MSRNSFASSIRSFFLNKEDSSNTSDKDVFETQHSQIKMDLPGGPVRFFRFFMKKCLRDIQKPKSITATPKFRNFPQKNGQH